MTSIPTATEDQYMANHIRDNVIPRIFVTNMICLVAAYVGVAMRFMSRRLQRAEVRADDWWIVAGLTGFTAWIILFSVATTFGLGRHILLVTKFQALGLVMKVGECFYCVTIVCIKLSILCLYRRIFPQQRFRHALVATGTFILVWSLALLFVDIFSCVPVSSQSKSDTSESCTEYRNLVLAGGIINIVTDFVILALPMPLVWRIQTSKRRRWLLTITFMLGGCACIISVGRLVFVQVLSAPADPTWDDVKGALLSTAEMCVGILAACMAIWRPIFKRTTRPLAISDMGNCKSAYQPTLLQGRSFDDTSEQIKATDKIRGRLKAWTEADDDPAMPYSRMQESEIISK